MADTSTLFSVLSAGPRRRLLFLLCDIDEVTVPEGLVARGAVAHPTPDEDPVQSDSDQDFHIDLVHTHLPKLHAYDLIIWDRDEQIVRRGPAFDEIEPALHTLIANAETFPTDLF